MTASLKDFDFDPNRLPKAYLEAIGLATAAASHTEYAVETALTGFLGLDAKTGGALTATMNAPTRDNALRALAALRLKCETDIEAFERLLEAIRITQSKRNAIVHHSWAVHRQTGEVYRIDVNSRGDRPDHQYRVTLEHLKADAHEIQQSGHDLIAFVKSKNLMPRA